MFYENPNNIINPNIKDKLARLDLIIKKEENKIIKLNDNFNIDFNEKCKLELYKIFGMNNVKIK